MSESYKYTESNADWLVKMVRTNHLEPVEAASIFYVVFMYRRKLFTKAVNLSRCEGISLDDAAIAILVELRLDGKTVNDVDEQGEVIQGPGRNILMGDIKA